MPVYQVYRRLVTATTQNQCWVCKLPIAEGAPRQLHHGRPLWLGGDPSFQNVGMTHVECHLHPHPKYDGSIGFPAPGLMAVIVNIDNKALNIPLTEASPKQRVARCHGCMHPLNGSSCKHDLLVTKSGAEYRAIPYDGAHGFRCPDCNVETGGLHAVDCDIALCPICGGQLLSCNCSIESFAHMTEDVEDER